MRPPHTNRDPRMTEAALAFQDKNPELRDLIAEMIGTQIVSHLRKWDAGIEDPKEWGRFSTARLSQHKLIHDWCDYLKHEPDVYGCIAFIQHTLDKANDVVKKRCGRAAVPAITLRNMKDALTGVIISKVLLRNRCKCGAKNAQLIYDAFMGSPTKRAQMTDAVAAMYWAELLRDAQHYRHLATRKQIKVALKVMIYEGHVDPVEAQELLLTNTVVKTWIALSKRGMLQIAAEAYQARNLPRHHVSVSSMIGNAGL